MYIFILIIVLLSGLGIGCITYKSKFNPLVIFNGLWLCLFFLYSLELSVYSSKLSLKGFIVFFSFIISFNVAYIIVHIVKQKTVIYYGRKDNSKKRSIKLNCNKILLLFKIWLILIMLEVIYCKGVPLLWMIMGTGGSYATFGIPSFHGFVNSLSWVITMLAFSAILNKEKNYKKMIYVLLAVNVVYILLLARQSIVTEIIQLVIVFALKKNIKIRSCIKYAVLLIIVFGLIGNIRTGYEEFLAFSRTDFQIPYLLIGFLWAYMYMVSPLANIDSLVNFNFAYTYGTTSVESFLPTVISNMIFGNVQKDVVIENQLYLVYRTFNVSSALKEPYVDFGVFGVIIFGGILGIAGSILWSSYIRNRANDSAIVSYSVYIGALLLTFFANMFLSLPIVIQFIYISIFFKYRIVVDEYIEKGE